MSPLRIWVTEAKERVWEELWRSQICMILCFPDGSPHQDVGHLSEQSGFTQLGLNLFFSWEFGQSHI